MAQQFDKLTVTISSPSLGTRTLENLKNVLILANHEEDSQDRTGVYKALFGAVNKRDRIDMMASLLTNKDRTAAQFREAAAFAVMAQQLDIGLFSGTEVKEDRSIPMDDRAGGINNPDLQDGPVGDFLRDLARRAAGPHGRDNG